MKSVYRNYSQYRASVALALVGLIDDLIVLLTLGRYASELRLKFAISVSNQAADDGFVSIIKDFLKKEPLHERGE